MKAMVEPLPLVPAIWITGGRRRSGWPSASRMRHIRSSERSISLGCSVVSRASVESIGVIPNAEGSRLRQYRQILGGRLRLHLGQEPAQIGQRRPQLAAVDHHVDHPVVLEIFGALEALRQLLADGLLDHARA